MNARNDGRSAWRDLCRDLREDDGIDPRELKKQHEARGRQRLGPLCKQVSRCLQLALAGCADESIRDLMIVQVEPAPDATRLRIVVCQPFSDEQPEPTEIGHRLHRLKGFLRAQIASAVKRKRAPDLIFSIVTETEGRS